MSLLHPAAELALHVYDLLIRQYTMLSEEQLRGCVVIEMTERALYDTLRGLHQSAHLEEMREYLRGEALPTLAGFTVYTVRKIPGPCEDEWRVRNLLGTR